MEILISIWEIIKVIATIVTMLSLSLLIYSYYRLNEVRAKENKELDKLFTAKKERDDASVRWEKIESLIRSAHPSDWKIAILEADSMLDDVIKKMGVTGETMGDRMKKLDPSEFPQLDAAWEAHKLRNLIAHQGAEYPLTRTEADDTLDKYHRVFKALDQLS